MTHKDKLINEMIGYLFEYWNNEDLDTIYDNFRRLGFTESDFKKYGIDEEFACLLEQLEEE